MFCVGLVLCSANFVLGGGGGAVGGSYVVGVWCAKYFLSSLTFPPNQAKLLYHQQHATQKTQAMNDENGVEQNTDVCGLVSFVQHDERQTQSLQSFFV